MHVAPPLILYISLSELLKKIQRIKVYCWYIQDQDIEVSNNDQILAVIINKLIHHMQVMQFYSQFSLSDNSSMDTEGALPGMVGYFVSVFTSNWNLI